MVAKMDEAEEVEEPGCLETEAWQDELEMRDCCLSTAPGKT